MLPCRRWGWLVERLHGGPSVSVRTCAPGTSRSARYAVTSGAVVDVAGGALFVIDKTCVNGQHTGIGTYLHYTKVLEASTAHGP